MHCRLERKVFKRRQITCRMRQRTVSLKERRILGPGLTTDDFENLSCGSCGLSLHELIQPLLGLLDVLDSKKILNQFDCVALSNVTCPSPRERTHGIVVA